MTALIITTTTSPPQATILSHPFFNDKPDREFDNITSKFIFDLKAKTATDDATDVTESTVFDDTLNRKFDNDDDSEI